MPVMDGIMFDMRLFWRHVDKTATCWNWTASTNSRGYGTWAVQQNTKLAHRVAYTALVGEIPDGLTIDHLCRNKLCVNPAHLEAVTLEENLRRAAESRTPCRHGRATTFADGHLIPFHCDECRRAHVETTQAFEDVFSKMTFRPVEVVADSQRLHEIRVETLYEDLLKAGDLDRCGKSRDELMSILDNLVTENENEWYRKPPRGALLIHEAADRQDRTELERWLTNGPRSN